VKGRELHIARSDGTEIRKLAAPTGSSPYWVRWSPDGSRVRFSVDDASLWEAPIDGSRAYPHLPGWDTSSPACCGTWTPDGKYFVLQASRNGTANVWVLREKVGLFRRAERGPFQLTNGPLSTSWPTPSTDGKRLFVDGRQDRNEFLRYDLKSRQLVPEFNAEGAISGYYIDQNYVYQGFVRIP